MEHPIVSTTAWLTMALWMGSVGLYFTTVSIGVSSLQSTRNIAPEPLG